MRIKTTPAIDDPQILARFWRMVSKTDGCWYWLGAKRAGVYGRFWVNGRLYIAHRLSYAIHNGPIDSNTLVLHKCDTPPCVNPGHLFPGDWKDNSQDMARKGRNINDRGEACHFAKLNLDQVRTVRDMIAAGRRRADIAAEFGVSISCITFIAINKNWRHFT